MSDLELICGNAMIWKDGEPTPERRAFQEFFTLTMIKVLDATPTRISGASSYNWLYWPIAIVALTLLLASYFISSGSPPAEPDWEEYYGRFSELKKTVASGIDYSQAQKLLADLETIEQEGRHRYAEQVSSITKEFSDVRDKLVAVQPHDFKDIVEEVARLSKRHGPNLIKFYEELVKLARQEKSQMKWSAGARADWAEIEEFADNVLKNGLTLKLGSSSLKGYQWWLSYIGANDLKLELWSAPIGDPKPFDDYSVGQPSIGTKWKKPVYSGKKDYSCRWDGGDVPADGASECVVKLEEQIWVRIMESSFTNRTLFEAKVERDGAVGLDWFGKPQTKLSYNGHEYEVIIRLEAEPSVPRAIAEAFESN